MWGYLVWGVFWVSAAAGLLMSDKTSTTEETPPVLPRTRIAFDADLESVSIVTAGAAGTSDLRVALRLPQSLAGADAVRTWLAEGPKVDLEVDIGPKSGAPRTVAIAGSTLKLLPGETDGEEARVVIARIPMTVDAGTEYRIATRVARSDDVFPDLDPVLLIGEARELVLPQPPDPTAGLLMLFGAMGIVSQLTMIIGRRLVPMREPLPAEGPFGS